VHPTWRGRAACGVLLLYCLLLFWAAKAIPDLYPPVSEQPAVAVEQTLERVKHAAWFATFAVVPLALGVGWGCANSIKTLKWPALGNYVPIKLRVRKLSSPWAIWLLLAVTETNFILVAAMAWWHYFQVREVWASYGILAVG